MIGILKGEILELDNEYIILDVNNVGYRIFCSKNSHQQCKIGEYAKFYIHTSVREDAILLYGFTTKLEYTVFLKLISVSKIGGKVALGILSALDLDKIISSIKNNDPQFLTKAPGVGIKTAQRIVLELRDKFDEISIEGSNQINTKESTTNEVLNNQEQIIEEAMNALMALGYTRSEIIKVMKKIEIGLSTEETIKLALKELSL